MLLVILRRRCAGLDLRAIGRAAVEFRGRLGGRFARRVRRRCSLLAGSVGPSPGRLCSWAKRSPRPPSGSFILAAQRRVADPRLPSIVGLMIDLLRRPRRA